MRLAIFALIGSAALAQAPADVEFFEKEVRPLLRSNCQGCHSVDGSAGAGPSWKGIWGRQSEFADGGKSAGDENYIRESILEPQAHLVKGFGPVMPSYKGILQDKEIDAIISFMKTLQ